MNIRAGLLAAIAALTSTSCGVAPPKIIPVESHEVNEPYALPFCDTRYYVVLQGQNARFSHSGRHAYAIDFSMPEGTPICAARAGRVVAIKEDSDSGGSTIEYAELGNKVVIEHADGTRATYLHLEKDGALVNVGECVTRGQEIALSGNTGWSTRPHLHFVVQAIERGQGWWSVPVTFETETGPREEFWFGRRARHVRLPEPVEDRGSSPQCTEIHPPPGKNYRSLH